jgi:hypothetical protein
MHAATTIAYLVSCVRPLSTEPLKLMYFESRNPLKKVIGKVMNSEAMCGDSATTPKSTICLRTTK